jgi:HEAT repeat protein
VSTSAALARVDAMFGSRRKRRQVYGPGEVADLQVAALHHPDPYMRRTCLWVLDHHANDASMPVFTQALRDDVDFVRDMALHSVACEGCKTGELCLTDVVPPLARVLEEDPKPDLRIKALTALVGLSTRDARARSAIERAGTSDSDAQVRSCAAQAATGGGYVIPKKRYERRQRRHAALGHGTLP